MVSVNRTLSGFVAFLFLFNVGCGESAEIPVVEHQDKIPSDEGSPSRRQKAKTFPAGTWRVTKRKGIGVPASVRDGSLSVYPRGRFTYAFEKDKIILDYELPARSCMSRLEFPATIPRPGKILVDSNHVNFMTLSGPKCAAAGTTLSKYALNLKDKVEHELYALYHYVHGEHTFLVKDRRMNLVIKEYRSGCPNGVMFTLIKD